MLCVIPFHSGDAAQAINLIKWIHELGGCHGHDCLLVVDEGVDASPATEAAKLAAKSFDNTELILCENAPKGWPMGANAMWLRAAEHCNDIDKPFLFLEPDAIPMREKWMDELQDAYAKCGKPFMAFHYPNHTPGSPSVMMSGIAVYPAHAIGWKQTVAAEAFDVALSRYVMNECAHTELIQHVWGENNLPPIFVLQKRPSQPKNALALSDINPKAAIFHRNKDGSLIQLLREQRGIFTDTPVAQRWPPQPPKTASPLPVNGGGGGILGSSGRPIRVRRSGALGDVLCATAVAKMLKEQGHKVIFQAGPAAHCILRRVPYIDGIEEPIGHCDINLDGAYERNPHRRVTHFAQMFVEQANHGPVRLPPARNFAPKMVLEPHELASHYALLKDYPKPWVMICPRSDSHLNRTVPDHIWQEAAAHIQGTCFWVGRHPGPSNIVDLGIRHFDDTIKYLGLADLLVSVDSGPPHCALALGTPCVVIQQQSDPALHFSDQSDFEVISPPLHCLNCCDTLCRVDRDAPPCMNVDPQMIARAANKKLEMVTTDGVSAAICIWRPDVARLNRCLSHVIDQVQEVVVSVDASGMIPSGAMENPKIRYVRHPKRDIGYSRNANFCVRHTNNKYVHLMNDDVFLEAGVVDHLKSVMNSDESIGIVGHLLRYPDKRIQHGGCYRNPGDIGHGHLDLYQNESRFKEPVELECVTGASILVRRDAFYKAEGFDEEIKFYCEDNLFCWNVRRMGYKVMFTPMACAEHQEHASTYLKPEIQNTMAESHAIFKRKVGWWFEKNKWTVPGTFD